VGPGPAAPRWARSPPSWRWCHRTGSPRRHRAAPRRHVHLPHHLSSYAIPAVVADSQRRWLQPTPSSQGWHPWSWLCDICASSPIQSQARTSTSCMRSCSPCSAPLMRACSDPCSYPCRRTSCCSRSSGSRSWRRSGPFRRRLLTGATRTCWVPRRLRRAAGAPRDRKLGAGSGAGRWSGPTRHGGSCGPRWLRL
jgi:hypothetical protein